MKDRTQMLAALHESTKEARYLASDEPNWQLCKTTNRGAKIYKTSAPNGRPHKAFKADLLVTGSLERVFDIMHPCTQYYKRLWDPMTRTCEVLTELAPNALLLHIQMKPALMGLITARDSIDLCLVTDEDDLKSVEIGSIAHEDYPPTDLYIRAWTYPAGAYLYRTKDPHQTRVICIFQADINSKFIPQSLLEASLPTMMAQYCDALQKTETLAWVPLVDVPGRRNPATFVCKFADDDISTAESTTEENST